MGYLVEGILPQRHGERYKLRKLATCYFLQEGILFKKGYDGDPLRCLGPEKANEILKEVHTGECGEHQGRKKLYIYIIDGLLLVHYEKGRSRICEEMPWLPSASQFDL